MPHRPTTTLGLGFINLSGQRFLYRELRQSPPTSDLAKSAFHVVVRNPSSAAESHITSHTSAVMTSVSRNGRHSSTKAATKWNGGGERERERETNAEI